MASIDALLASVKEVKKAVNSVEGKQVFAKPLLASIHGLANTYFSQTRADIASRLHDSTSLSSADEVFQSLASLSRKHPSKEKCLSALTSARQALVSLEGLTLSHSAHQSAGRQSRTDELIISTLSELCPSAALAYQQALIDLAQPERHSWRGPATDLREALRETLDLLAPDAEVEKMPGYRHESDAKRPTMKQKARYILRNRGLSSGQLATPESAITGLEDMLGGLTRSVYTRSSVSTHTPTTKEEVVRVHAWVRLVLCELLELPLT